MKGTRKLIAALLMSITSVAFCQSGPRKVAWVHGFGGQHCSLQALNRHFEANYEIESVRLSYNTQKGISKSGSTIAKALNQYFDPDDKRSLGIGHSMGGLNLRYSEISTPDIPLGGVITIGTPHEGAALASMYLNGGMDAFINKMAGDLLAGPRADKFASAFIYQLDPILDLPLIKLLNKSEFSVMDLVNLFGEGKSFDFLNYLLDSEETIRDLAPGSQGLELLNSINSERKAYAIWGNEDSPVHWRFLSSLISSSCNETIGDKTDELLVNKIGLVKNLYQAMETTNRVVCQVAYFFSFGLSNKKSINTCLLANKYARGKNWIIDSEEHWLRLIGATYKTTATVTVSQFLCQQELEEARRSNDFDMVQKLLDNDDCWLVYKIEREVWLKQASDGLVTRQSASAFPGAEVVLEAKGANHFELLYHTSVKNALEEIVKDPGEWSFVARR